MSPPAHPVPGRSASRADRGAPSSRVTASGDARGDRSESGDTLIEILFAIAILGIASVALLVAFAASISASAVHRSFATFDTVIRSASQQAISQIQQQPDPLYESCAPLSYYQSGSGAVQFNLPSGYTAQVTNVQYWTGSTFTTNLSQCQANGPQWITITVTNTATGQSFPNNFIVEDPYAPPVPVGGPAYQLVFVQQPSSGDAGVAFGQQPSVAVLDRNGNVVTTDLSPVTLTITTGTGTPGASLSQYCTGVENSGVVTFAGCSINMAGLDYQLTATDPGSGSGALVPAISTAFNVYTQLNQPVITSLIPSTTEVGAVNVTFTGSSNAPSGENYTVTACANAGVGFGCVTQNNFTSGSDLTGLTPGTSYYVTVTANAPTPLYLPATSATAGPALATVQLNPPGTPTLAFGSVPGSIQVSFTTPTPAAPTQVYTATACTNASMTTGCVTGNVTPGGNLTGLGYTGGSPGASYYVTVTAAGSSGYFVSPPSAVSGPQAAVSQLNAPTGFSTASSTTTPGAISLTFTASAGPQSPASYTATVCTNAAMTAGCTTQSVTPGANQITGLTQGTNYFATVTANAPSAAFLPITTSVSPAVLATTQLSPPTGVNPNYGTVAGSINITFSPPANAASGQTYTATACTNAAMSTGCVSNGTFGSGSNLSGLSYTQGSPGTTYYVTVTSNPSSGYFASAPSAVQSQVDTSKLNPPGTPSAATSATQAGAIVITFAAPTGTAPVGYTATACTNSSMTTGCQSSAITSGGTMSGLAQGASYWVTVTANPPAGYVSATSPISTSSTGTNTQLATPTINAVAPSTTTAGQLTITYTGSSNAPGGQTYTATACTDGAMTLNCVSHNPYTSGSQFTGLTSGSSYYVTITANPSSGYLAATTSPVGPTLATVQLATPAAPTLGYGSVAGSVSITASVSNGPAGQLFTVVACTNASMSTGCATTTNVVSGGNATGLAFTAGSAGGNYYATVLAQASPGYLASGTSPAGGPHADTSQLLAPGTPSPSPSTTTAGAITATFTNSGGPTVSGYSGNACTNVGMTSGCVTQAGYTSGAQLTGLVQGTKYYVTITALSSSAAYAPSTSSVSATSALATVQLATPTITAVAPSTTTPGAITITFTGSSNAPAGQTYIATACTNATMTTGCLVQAGYVSGAQLSGLTSGTSYYVTLTAAASSGYLPATTGVVGPTLATVQLATPGTPVLAYGTVAGSIAVTASSSNAPAGQLFQVKACTNSTMSSGCVTDNNVASGANATGLAFTAGQPGTSYWVNVIAQASPGYLASGTSPTAGPQADTSSLSPPTNLVTASSTTTAGAISATFTASSGAAPSSYTATSCTNVQMTIGCVTFPNDTSGTLLTGLTQGSGYYTTITAVSGSAAYASATTAPSGPTLAATQLTAPTNVTLAYGTVAGSVQVSFTGSSNAAAGQTYTAKACTNAAMTAGCVTNANFGSGANLTGLAYTQGAAGGTYYVTVAANASNGYLGSPPSAVAGPQADTSQLDAPGTPTPSSSTIVAGAITATFTTSGGTAPISYTAKACTNAAMSTGCDVQTNYTSGAQIDALSEGLSYWVSITAVPPSAAFVPATSPTSASSALATTQLVTPTINGVAPSTTTAGAMTIAYTGSANAPTGQTYTATECTDIAMTQGCVTTTSYVSGTQITNLTSGTAYYVTITAPASNGYLAATTAVVGPTLATVQLATPGTPTLAYGASAGSLNVSATSSNAPSGQLYTVRACTNSGMTAGCVTSAPVPSGTDVGSLSFTQGSPGASYYVTVVADASSGYLQSGASPVGGPHADTSQIGTPGTPSVASSTTTAGAITATFTASAGTAPVSYTAVACTNASMSAGCVNVTNYTSGAQLTGLTGGSSYWVQVMAVPPAGFVAATSATSASSAVATTQLGAPTNVTLAYGTVAGSVAVTFTGSSGAPTGETYTAVACTNAAMTSGCVTNASFTSGANLTGLAFSPGSPGTAYYVTVAANPATGYLGSAASSVAGPQNATSVIGVPGTPVVASSTTTPGAITATFAAPSGTAPVSYSARACTNAAMTTGCVTQSGYTSGAQLTGLTQGVAYWAQITAVGPAGYVSSTSATSISSAVASSQLNPPTNVTLAYGTSAGSIQVSFTGSSNAPSGETYTVMACTNVAMTAGCVSNASFTSGSSLTGLAYTQGSPGTAYYATVTANPSSGYFGSNPSAVAGPQNATSQLNAPGTPSAASSTTTAGAITATFAPPLGPSPASYSATACTNAGMTAGCVTVSGYVSGGSISGLVAGTAYWADITANPPAGYVGSTSATSATSAAATIQLSVPTITGVSPSTTTAGQLTVTFNAPANAPGGQAYTVTACTNATMTSGCVTQPGYVSGAQVTGLAAGTNYYVTITANASSGYLASTSSASGPTLATVQLTTPTITTVAPSTTTTGALTIAYNGSTNAPGGQTYTAMACTDAAMTIGCISQAGYTSGAQLTGLASGQSYYVNLTANASSGYLAITTTSVGPTLATIQLTTPTGVSLAYGTVAGSVTVSFTGSSNAPGGQLYTAKACTNAGMTTGCVSGAVTPGGNLTGLNYTPGSAGTSYYVTVTANASSGYLASAASSVAGPHADTSQVSPPTGLATAPSTTNPGAITATFTASTGTAPTSYTATACTDAAMTIGCVSVSGFTSGGAITGLTAGTNYYVQITANPPAGYVSAASSVSSPTLATVQLTAPTGVTLGYGTTAGSLSITFTGSSNAPGGQTYTATACTNAAMTTGCVSGTVASGGNLTGLAYTQGVAGTSYYATVVANASSGYLTSPTLSVVGPQADTSQVNPPTALAPAPSTTTAGAITATFTASTGPAPTSYTATACTNVLMTTGCVSVGGFTSGGAITGLSAGTSYYVQVTANPPAGYASAASAVSAATLATVQLAAPTGVTLAYGTVAGSIAVTFTGSSNAPGGQAYTATACTNAAMTLGCVSQTISSGANLTGLLYVTGSPGTSYYVSVVATASSGYLTSAGSAVAGPQAATSQVNAPGGVTATTGGSHGRINVTFLAPAGTAPASYTAIVCTNAAMTAGCTNHTNFVSNTQITGLTTGTTYYVEVQSVGPSGYLNATSSPPSSAVAS